MQTPEFWISRYTNPDRVFMTPAQITDLNHKNRTRSFECRDVNGNMCSILPTMRERDYTLGLQYHIDDPLSMKNFPGDSLRARLARHGEAFDLTKLYGFRQARLTPLQIREIRERVNETAIPETITPRYGILVAHTHNRALPTSEALYSGPGEWLDEIQSTALDLGMRVAVLHASPDNDWYYIRSEIAFGWIPAVNVAVGSPEVIGEYVNSPRFIVAVTHKVPLYGDSGFRNFITDIYMGARIRLVGKTAAGYHVLAPFRAADGTLKFVDAWVKPDAKVSVGYQAFTQRNILNTVFDLLYRPYSWADERYERDCCGTMRAMLRTFGIFTGRWTTMELHSSDHVAMFDAGEKTKELKYRHLDSCEPAITLVGDPGHISMYLGRVDGKYFVIHQSGYSYTDKDGISRMVRRMNVNDTELEGGSNVTLWREITEFRP